MQKKFVAIIVLSIIILNMSISSYPSNNKKLLEMLDVNKYDFTVKKVLDDSIIQNPVVQGDNEDDVLGLFSIENFYDQFPLQYTNESAEGFKNYLVNWSKTNFELRDQEVQAWQFRILMIWLKTMEHLVMNIARIMIMMIIQVVEIL